jgi:hypothetical protein
MTTEYHAKYFALELTRQGCDKEGVEPHYKVRLIEEEFKRLMFDVKDV